MNGNIKKCVTGQGPSTPLKEFHIRLERCDAPSPVPSPCKKKKVDSLDEIIQNDHIIKEMIGRKDQFRMLNNLFGDDPLIQLPRCAFLWGPPSSGKTFTLDVALKDKPFQVIKINCAEILCGRRAFYETLVKQLIKTEISNLKCDSLHSLYTIFLDYFTNSEEVQRVVLVIKGVENLRGEHDDILRFMASFQDVLQHALCVVFISSLPPQQYIPNIMDHSIIPLYFPQYSMDELNKILIGQKSKITNSLPDSFYAFYVKMIVSMFYFACRDLRKLSRLTRSHWPKFHELADASPEINEMKLLKLWKTLEPQLKAQFFELNSTLTSIKTDNKQEPGRKMSMPLNAKYLVIASYLATHNPPASDKRFFVKTKQGRGKKSRTALTKTETKPTVRVFELNRLSAIFGSVQGYCDDKAVNKNRNVSFMSLLTTLCANKLIQYIGEDSFGNQKYRCLLDYDTVLEISKSVNFELNNYLYRLV